MVSADTLTLGCYSKHPYIVFLTKAGFRSHCVTCIEVDRPQHVSQLPNLQKPDSERASSSHPSQGCYFSFKSIASMNTRLGSVKGGEVSREECARLRGL